MSKWLMLRPVIDEVTEITFNEAQDVLDHFDDEKVEYIDLAKGDVTRENVERILKENPGISVLHYDHGNETSWIGEQGEAVIDLRNVELLRERECYCNNCSSAKTLGVEAWKRKVKAYWGYTDIFYFTTDSLEEVQEFVNHGIKSRIYGFSWKLCLEKAKRRATELIDDLVAAGKSLAASCLRHDRDHLVCYTEEMPPPPEPCPVSRIIVAIFGYRVLSVLRRVRDDFLLSAVYH